MGESSPDNEAPRRQGRRSTTRRMVWAIVRIVIGVYVGLAIVLYLLQSKLIYFPEREIADTPQSLHLAYREVSFRAADGVTLSGWYVPAAQGPPGGGGDPPRAVLLFCHGNAGNISHRLGSIAIFHELGLSTFIFDYRGYGRSEGKPAEAGTYLDAEAAWRFLTDEAAAAPERIVVFGRSLGTAVAAHLARTHTPAALILESSFTSVPDVAAKMYPFFPVRLLCRFRYDTRAYVRLVHCPVLVAHSIDDEMIPYAHGRAVFEAAGEPKAFLDMRGGHNEGHWITGQEYKDALTAFIDRHVRR